MSLFLRQLRAELHKLFARKRSYLGFGAFVVLELLALAILQLPRTRAGLERMLTGQGVEFAQYYSGLTLAFIILAASLLLIGSLFLALVAGDVVAKEVEDGTMRMMLCRPVSRVRVITVKYVACIIYTFALMLFLGASVLVLGLLRRGTGGLFVLMPLEGVFGLFDFGDGLQRYLFALLCIGMSFSTISSIGFMLSCCKMKPAAATITTLSIVFIDFVFRMTEHFASIREFLLTTHMSTWSNVFRSPVPLWRMVEDYAYLFGADITLVVVGALIFISRDLKS